MNWNWRMPDEIMFHDIPDKKNKNDNNRHTTNVNSLKYHVNAAWKNLQYKVTEDPELNPQDYHIVRYLNNTINTWYEETKGCIGEFPDTNDLILNKRSVHRHAIILDNEKKEKFSVRKYSYFPSWSHEYKGTGNQLLKFSEEIQAKITEKRSCFKQYTFLPFQIFFSIITLLLVINTILLHEMFTDWRAIAPGFLKNTSFLGFIIDINNESSRIPFAIAAGIVLFICCYLSLYNSDREVKGLIGILAGIPLALVFAVGCYFINSNNNSGLIISVIILAPLTILILIFVIVMIGILIFDLPFFIKTMYKYRASVIHSDIENFKQKCSDKYMKLRLHSLWAEYQGKSLDWVDKEIETMNEACAVLEKLKLEKYE